MTPKQLGPELLSAVAERFKVLAEPARLAILNELRKGPLHVGALTDETGLNQANLSKHLQLLHAHGFVARRREGLFVHYELADESVFALCDIMCGQLKRQRCQTPFQNLRTVRDSRTVRSLRDVRSFRKGV